MHRLVFGIATLLVALWPADVAAQDAAQEIDLPPWARAERSYAGLGAEVMPVTSELGDRIETRLLAVGFEPFVQVAVTPNWVVSASLPFGYASHSVDVARGPMQNLQGGNITDNTLSGGRGYGQFVLGSLSFGGHYTANVMSDQLNLWAGLTLAIPTMLMRGNDSTLLPSEAQLAGRALGTTRAGTHPHRFASLQIGLRPGAGLEWRSRAEWIFLRSSLAPTVLAPVGGDVDVEVAIDHHSEFELRSHVGFGGGLGLQEAFRPTADTGLASNGTIASPALEALLQVALEPFLGFESPGTGWFARAGVLVALTKQARNLRGGYRVVTPRLTAGATW